MNKPVVGFQVRILVAQADATRTDAILRRMIEQLPVAVAAHCAISNAVECPAGKLTDLLYPVKVRRKRK